MANFRKGGAGALNSRTCEPCLEGDHHQCWEQAGIDHANQSMMWWEIDHSQLPDFRAMTYCACYHAHKERLHPRYEPEDLDLEEEEYRPTADEFHTAMRDATDLGRGWQH